MTAKHTPGPWRLISDEVRSNDNRLSICEVTGGSGAQFVEDDQNDECLANAQLIAASPDMHAALVRISDRLEAWAEAHEHLSTVSRSESEIESHANRAANYRELIRIARDSMPKS